MSQDGPLLSTKSRSFRHLNVLPQINDQLGIPHTILNFSIFICFIIYLLGTFLRFKNKFFFWKSCPCLVGKISNFWAHTHTHKNACAHFFKTGPGCPGTPSVDHTGLELEICLPLAGIKGVCHHNPALPFETVSMIFFLFNWKTCKKYCAWTLGSYTACFWQFGYWEFYVNILKPYVYKCLYACLYLVLTKARREHRILWDWNYK